jgi:hypothetical protein
MCGPENRSIPIDRKAYDILLKGYNRSEIAMDECTYLLKLDEK